MDLEARLLALALSQGLITPPESQADPRPDPDAPSAVWGPRIATLVASGRLDAAWVEEQARALATPPGSQEDPGWEIQTSPGLPSSWGRYRDLSLVAVGGQGRVYRAKDTLLDREVALKFLRWDSPLQRDWLLREGRAQAKVAHPGICPVHEVGELGGETYLALAWIEGPSLKEALPGLDTDSRLDLLVQACESVHAAHLEGLVHLDLKPGNLLLERLPGNRLRVRVGDFGLAWRAGEAPMGRVGTPPYASPEQLQGGPVQPGPTADVYALGVLLHQVLTGRLPHEAGEPRLRGDAARLFAKATALDPGRRHPSAQALALDLQALREGRPLPGLRTAPWHRARLWARRHRAGTAALAAGLACLLLGGAQLLRLRLQARAQARLAQRFGQDLQAVEALLRQSHLSPPHDRRPTLARVRERMGGIRRAMAGLDTQAQGEGWYALGRAHQLLGEDHEGLEGLEAAWSRGMRSPECAEALGLARATVYLDAIRNLGVDLGRAPNHPAVAELRQKHALPAADLLARAAKENPDAARVLEAVRADIEGRAGDAERLAAEALVAPAVQPWDVLPWRILTQYWEYRAQVAIGLRKLDSARSQLTRAWSALHRAQEAARSDPSLRLSEGWLAFTEAHILEEEGRIPSAAASLDRAVAAFAFARNLQPDLLLARKYLLDGLRRRVALRRTHGLPVRASLEEALAALGEAEARSPGEAWLRMPRRRILHEAMLVAWSDGGAVDGPETRRYRTDLPAGLPPEEAAFADAQLDLEIAEELLRRNQDARAFLEASRAPVQACYEQAPRAPGRLAAWVDWGLADGEARLRAKQALDGPALDRLAAALEARIQRDGPLAELNGRLQQVRRLQSRDPMGKRAVTAPGAPGP